MQRPVILITLGDIAGIGPEIVLKAWRQLHDVAHPIVVGTREALVQTAAVLTGEFPEIIPAASLEVVSSPSILPVIEPSQRDLSRVVPGQVSAEAGGAAYDFLTCAIDYALAGKSQAIVTCPLHKEGLHAAGIPYPGHTEILAARTGTPSHAMLLYDNTLSLAVAHVTLHTSVRKALLEITTENVFAKIRLLAEITPRLTGRFPAKIAVAALNPHAGDGGLFGDEESRILQPAIQAAQAEGLIVEGPFPADALFLPHLRSRFDGIVAMLHDHGHIAMKLLGGRRAVNVTAGLPIVRTSVAHGTAYDIVHQGIADESSLIAAVATAARLCAKGAPSSL